MHCTNSRSFLPAAITVPLPVPEPSFDAARAQEQIKPRSPGPHAGCLARVTLVSTNRFITRESFGFRYRLAQSV